MVCECCCLVTKSYRLSCDPIDCRPPGSSVHGISQARMLEWVAFSFSRGSFWPGDRVSCIGRWGFFVCFVFHQWATREAWYVNMWVCCLVAQSYPTPWDPTDCSTPGLPVRHQLLEFPQTHVHRVGDAIQTSHPLSSPSPPAFNLSQHQGLVQWVSSSNHEAKELELELQHQSFQWIWEYICVIPFIA